MRALLRWLREQWALQGISPVSEGWVQAMTREGAEIIHAETCALLMAHGGRP